MHRSVARPEAPSAAALRAASARERLRLVEASADPAALVAGLTPTELFATIHEIGADEALDLIAAAAPSQLRLCIDLECQSRGRFAAPRFDRWIARLLEIGPDALARCVRALDYALVAAYLAEHLEVRKRADDDEATALDDPRFQTLDELYDFAIRGTDPDRARRLRRLLEVLQGADPELYVRLMEGVRQDLPAQLEDDAMRLGAGRLLDLGIPTYDLALEVYAWRDPATFDPAAHRKWLAAHPPPSTDDDAAGAPHGLVRVDAPAGSFLARALRRVDASLRPDLEAELAWLFHAAGVVSVADVTDLAALREAACDVQRYLSMGLEHAAGGSEARAHALVVECRLAPLVQVGISLTLRLGRRAERLVRSRWFDPWGGRPMLLGDELAEVLNALVRRRPAYARTLDEPGTPGERPFETLADVERAAAALVQAEAVAVLMHDRLTPHPAGWHAVELAGHQPDRHDDLGVAHVVNAVAAHLALDGTARLAPVEGARLRELVDRLLAPARRAGPAQIDETVVRAVHAWLTDRVAGLPPELVPPIERIVDQSLGELASELASLADGDGAIDPRFVASLWLHP